MSHVWLTHTIPSPLLCKAAGQCWGNQQVEAYPNPLPTTTPKSIITFEKQLGTGASSPLLISPLKRCHSECQEHARP